MTSMAVRRVASRVPGSMSHGHIRLCSTSSKTKESTDWYTLSVGAAIGAAACVSFGATNLSASSDSYPPTGVSPGVKKLDQWIQLGCGDVPYNCPEKNATFAPDGKNPEQMPDLSKHSNFMAELLTPEVYNKLKTRTTASGTTLAQCIKTGVDNPGHPHIKTVGMVACDEESYDTFKELFDPIISARHNGYAPDANQPTNLDISQLSDTDIDPEGKYVLTTRVRTGRSVRGFKLPPTISFEDRRRLEGLCVKALCNMEGDLKGEYFPLHGSRSYAAKPNGMTEGQEDSLRKCGNLFQEPDSTLLLASGMGRHWPDGRGVFHNKGNNLFVWVGEEDHLRIVSMQGNRETPSVEGKSIKEVVARFIRAGDEVQKVLKSADADFMHNDHLGWVLTCPSNLGTGLRAGTMVKLPGVSGRPDWKALCAKMGLQARGTGGVDSANVGGTWDVSNADRIGKGEVDLVNTLIEGAAQLVKWESMYDNGQREDANVEICAKLEKEVTAQPAEPYPPTGLSGNIRKLPEWIQLGCGDAPYNCAEKNATFAIDGKSPDAMPDLTNHSNFMSECLTPEIWEALKDKTTSGGTTLAECIKTGVDKPGHPHT